MSKKQEDELLTTETISVRSSGDQKRVEFVQGRCEAIAHSAKHGFAGGPVVVNLFVEWPDGTTDAVQHALPKTCNTCFGIGYVPARPTDKPCPDCAEPA
jgi:hypothetical protein